ncbi:hypothetical protein EMIT0111MI5_70219 [Burkholderia sp. IT-111MI5]
MPDTIVSSVSTSSSRLRSRLPASDAINRLVASANAPDTEIAWPARPSLICRSLAIGVSRLTGMNSDATSTNAPSAIARTAPHAAGRTVASSRSEVEAACIVDIGSGRVESRRKRASVAAGAGRAAIGHAGAATGIARAGYACSRGLCVVDPRARIGARRIETGGFVANHVLAHLLARQPERMSEQRAGGGKRDCEKAKKRFHERAPGKNAWTVPTRAVAAREPEGFAVYRLEPDRLSSTARLDL